MKLKWVGAAVVVGLAAVGIWVARSGSTPASTDADDAAAGRTYDYEAHDVVVRQMNAAGELMYEVEARQVTQLPRNGQISAEELTIRHDPPGSPPDSPRRLTLTADRADLPQVSGALTLNGNVRASGRLLGAQAPLLLQTDQLTYDMEAQTISTESTVEVTSGGDKLRAKGLRADIKTGVLEIPSEFNGTFAP